MDKKEGSTQIRCGTEEERSPKEAGAVLKPHRYRELVNDLRDCAVDYHNHQSLRDRISRVLGRYITTTF